MLAQHHASSARTLATGLGWFSIGLGLCELLATRSLTRALGMRGHESLVRAYGVREIATGIGLLTARSQAPWLWGRVAGDALDLATLAGGLDRRRHRGNVGLAIAAVAGVTALDILAAQQLAAEQRAPRPPRRDYRNRTGFPRGPDAVRGAAGTQATPADFREPAAMRPAGWDRSLMH